ncbi:MAG: hypothetical protein ACFE8G_06780 [Candidatus Hermodarchaeota archaeon]
MAETGWKHAGWVSGLGKWAWIILVILGIIHIIVGTVPPIATWETGRALWALSFPAIPYPYPLPIGTIIWNVLGAIISIVVALFIIRPKFSKPCGAKDWEALYGWSLKLGGAYVPWMFIWGIVYAIFGWYSWPAIFILLPACMIIFAGPRKYDWKSK